MRRALLWSFLLSQALHLASAEPQHATGSEARDDAKEDVFYADVVSAQVPGQSAREPGAELVDTALSDLRRIYHPLHHQRRKKSGVLGTVMHYVLKATPTFRLSAPSSDTPKNIMSGPLSHAVKLLEESSQKNNSDALLILAELNFYGNFSHPRNFPVAFDYYQKLALLNGNSSALHMLGFMYSTGVGGAVEPDQARALLYYTFAANRGHTRAEMTVAHRQHSGVGTSKSCDTAVKYYKRVADKAVAWYRSGPPGGMDWVPEAYRIADETGGIYGAGASASSSGMNAIKAHPGSDAYASIEDIIEYLDLMSQKGDFKASFNLGRIYYEGQRGLDQDFEIARKYFYAVTQRFWKKGRVVETFKAGLDKTASKAAGYIGRMYLRGDGVEQNFDRAKFWFDRGIKYGDAQSQYGLALMLLNGYSVPRNIVKASELLKAAADQDFAPAQVQLGSLYLDQGHADDLSSANHYFELAARYGNIEAYYYLAEMNYFGVGRDKSCSVAVNFYKSVAEKAEPLLSSWSEANLAYEDGEYELAFLEYLGAAEQGYERAQNNVAYILDIEQSQLPFLQNILQRSQRPALLRDPTLALIYWTRSSRQGNIDSLVKMGDYYLNGVGTSLDVDKAVQCYSGASEYQQSAQALYNLGWMHENGVGLDQDYHLAKRYYDSALETNEESYLPVTLSLLKLRARSAWNTMTHGHINSIRDEPAPKKDWSIGEWVANFIQDDLLFYDDLYDDIYDDAMPGGDPGLDEFDDAIFEGLLILCLAAALVFLVLYRQQRQQAARRREEERRQQEQAGQGAAIGNPPLVQRGGFPQPGDPDFAQWGAGGVGH